MQAAFPQAPTPLGSVGSSSPSPTTSYATAGSLPRGASPPSPLLSSTPLSSSPFQVGDLVTPRYRITGHLGRGATSITYAAEHTASISPRPGRALALKVFPLAALASWKTLDVFQREAATLRTLAHPAIPVYIDFFELDDARVGRAFVLVQHRATGASLQGLTNYRFAFSTLQAYAVFRQLLEVLVYLEDLNPPLLHRDIKPDNVILNVSRDRHLLLSLVDFHAVNISIATPQGEEGAGEDQGVPAPFTAVGRSGFTPPEHFGGTVDARSDLYAAAATVLYMLTGRPLCTLPQTRCKIDMESVIPASERVKLGNLYTVMCKLLEPAPEDRYECAAEALDALMGNDNTNRAGECAEAIAGDGDGGKERGLARAGKTAFPGAEAVIANRAVQRLQMLARENGGEHGRGYVGEQFKLLAERAGGVSRSMGSKWDESEDSLQCDRSDRLLKVELSAKQFSGGALFNGVPAALIIGFSTWLTVSMLTNDAQVLLLLFTIPFWVCGVGYALPGISELTRKTTLVVSFGGGEREEYYFRLTKRGALRVKFVEGDARDLRAANMETRMYWSKSEPSKLFSVREVVLIEGNWGHQLGEYLHLEDKERLRDEINDFLNAHRR